MNATIVKFGYPATLIREYQHWLVLLRPAQVTLGALILAAKSDATAYADLPAAAFAEQAEIISDIEQVLQSKTACAKINYLMLMMVDPHVHLHVIPRYSGTRIQAGIALPDNGWPSLPALGDAVALSAPQQAALVAWLQAAWPTAR
jgi:diadenosine tetraphosphate (Ap4A) HIT family hydrolase